jgi:transposase-like protein
VLSVDVPHQQNQHIQMKQPITDALLDELLKNYSQPGDLFPTIDSLFKLFYLSLRNLSSKWTVAVRNWPSALSHFTIEFADRMPNN